MEFLCATIQWQHARDEHFKFHKVVWRRYSGEVEIVYTILQPIYSVSGVPNLKRFARVFLQDITKNILVSHFFQTHCTPLNGINTFAHLKN